MDALFGRVEIRVWQDQVRQVLELRDPDEMAAAYRRVSAGSAPGTLHDPGSLDSCPSCRRGL
jgi:hypothetical protein